MPSAFCFGSPTTRPPVTVKSADENVFGSMSSLKVNVAVAVAEVLSFALAIISTSTDGAVVSISLFAVP